MIINPMLKENRISGTLSKEAKKERVIYFTISLILFTLGSFLFFDFVYKLCNIVGAIVSATPAAALSDLKRSFPMMLLTVGVIHISIYLRCAYKAKSEGGRIKAFCVNGIISMTLGAVIFAYVFIGLINGQYAALIEGHPTLLFPLDMMVYGLLMAAHGVISFIYSIRLKKVPSALPYHEKSGCALMRGVNSFFYGVGYLIVLFSFASICYTPFVMDFTAGNLFFNVMMTLVHLTSVCGAAFYIFVFDEADQECKTAVQKQWSAVILGVNLILLILYIVSLQSAPEAPNLNAFGLLPIEYTASVNVFTLLYALLNICAPLSAFIKSFTKRKVK